MVDTGGKDLSFEGGCDLCFIASLQVQFMFVTISYFGSAVINGPLDYVSPDLGVMCLILFFNHTRTLISPHNKHDNDKMIPAKKICQESCTLWSLNIALENGP